MICIFKFFFFLSRFKILNPFAVTAQKARIHLAACSRSFIVIFKRTNNARRKKTNYTPAIAIVVSDVCFCFIKIFISRLSRDTAGRRWRIKTQNRYRVVTSDAGSFQRRRVNITNECLIRPVYGRDLDRVRAPVLFSI